MRGGRQCQVDSETRWLILWQEDTEWMSLESSLIYYFCNDYCIFFVRFLFLPTLLLLIYSYFRILSRNYPARNRENRWYLNATRMFRKNRSSYGNDAGTRQRDTAHRIFKCPNCSQKIRVPKGKGKICIRCPKCRIEFIKRT